jgi:hypothetical protein
MLLSVTRKMSVLRLCSVNFFQGFCSELILWRVDAVGPLSKSGGVLELARINSLEISAFSNVAWIPTLLPRCVCCLADVTFCVVISL